MVVVVMGAVVMAEEVMVEVAKEVGAMVEVDLAAEGRGAEDWVAAETVAVG